MEIIILVLSFLILLSIGVPIAWSIGISSILTMLVSIPTISAFTTVAQRMATGLDSFSLLAIPFFILGRVQQGIFGSRKYCEFHHRADYSAK